MAKLIWSPRALAELDEICEHIARDSKRYAAIFAERIVESAESIARSPRLSGMVLEYQRDDIRERLYGSYRIIYRLRDDAVEIVTIIHAARLPPPSPP